MIRLPDDGRRHHSSVRETPVRIAARVVWCVCAATSLVASPVARAQQGPDSTARYARDSVARRLAGAIITAHRPAGAVSAAPRLMAGVLTTGARSEVVGIAGTASNTGEKIGRQLFAEVPGLFVYDMDGSGNQVNISTRGLDAHRSWEFNVRQNGVGVNSDVYGYPASHYSAPMEAVDRVELVRGTAALQYGSQFGGLLNYVIRAPDTTRAASFESRSTTGSTGLLSTWNAVGGRVGRVSYYAYSSLRRSDGYRRNGASGSDAEYLSVALPVVRTLSIRAEVGRSAYRYQQPGPLSDSVFAREPRASTRARNWYSPDILVPSLMATWTPSLATRVTVLASGVFGSRSSVAVGGFATQADTPSSAGLWSARQVDIDRYDTRSFEIRGMQDLRVGSRDLTLSAGIALADNDLWRRQRGTGSTGSDYNLTLAPGAAFQRSLHYLSTNVAAYAESEVRLTPAWVIVPGVRVERGTTRMRGTLAYYDPADTPRDIRHNFPLFGLRSSFRPAANVEWYGGWSQAYRPMILKDVLPETATERTDPNLRDARGWTIESGVRSTTAHAVSYDVGVFAMRYANRFGMLTLTDPTGAPYTFKTNVGTALTRGIEARASAPLTVTSRATVRAFGAASFLHARYVGGAIPVAGRNVSITGNEVESAPRWILRSGLSATTRAIAVRAQWSYVSATFADALNTVTPNTTGAVGRVPSYALTDLSGAYTISVHARATAGINNFFNRQYFTKRPQFYPGPGVWPSDGRSVYLGLELNPR